MKLPERSTNTGADTSKRVTRAYPHRQCHGEGQPPDRLAASIVLMLVLRNWPGKTICMVYRVEGDQLQIAQLRFHY